MRTILLLSGMMVAACGGTDSEFPAWGMSGKGENFDPQGTPRKPDLVITELKWVISRDVGDHTMPKPPSFEFTVCNTGSVASPPFQVAMHFTIEPASCSPGIDPYPFEGLPPSGCISRRTSPYPFDSLLSAAVDIDTAPVEWDYPTEKVWAVADAICTVDEADENNNKLRTTGNPSSMQHTVLYYDE